MKKTIKKEKFQIHGSLLSFHYCFFFGECLKVAAFFFFLKVFDSFFCNNTKHVLNLFYKREKKGIFI